MKLVLFIILPILFGIIMELRTHFEGAVPRAIIAGVAAAVLMAGMQIGAQWRKTSKEVSQPKTPEEKGPSSEQR